MISEADHEIVRGLAVGAEEVVTLLTSGGGQFLRLARLADDFLPINIPRIQQIDRHIVQQHSVGESRVVPNRAILNKLHKFNLQTAEFLTEEVAPPRIFWGKKTFFSF